MAGPSNTPESPRSVAWLARSLQDWIGRLGSIWIEGELTQWNISRGNAYAKLKDPDEDATVSVNVWSRTLAQSPEFRQGDRIIALVKPDYYVRGGTLSMVAHEIRPVGIGELLVRLQQLREQLEREGLFDPATKSPLPFLPNVIGLVTGKDSDAEQDVLRNARLRWPGVRFRVEHAAVQGDNTVPTVIAALETLEADPEVDVIIIARGGGDFQNLLPFSDERLVRFVATLRTPVVSAIGHEPDHPILDDVADLRASTPTDAAKRIVPDVADELARIAQARAMLRARVTTLVTHQTQLVEGLRSRPVLADPSVMIERRADEIARLQERADVLTSRAVDRAESGVRELAARVRTLSPQATLDRGFAVVQHASGAVLRDAADTSPGDGLLITLASGNVSATTVATDETSRR